MEIDEAPGKAGPPFSVVDLLAHPADGQNQACASKASRKYAHLDLDLLMF
jgi:hypothetical protein